MSFSYNELLKRLRNKMAGNVKNDSKERVVLPTPEVQFIGNKTVLRNFMVYPRLMRRDPNRVLMFLATALATAASLDKERGIFIGRKDKQSFAVLLERYFRETVICPVCESPDTHIEKIKRLNFIICEACGARSIVKKM